MDKKIIGSILCIFILTLCAVPAMSENEHPILNEGIAFVEDYVKAVAKGDTVVKITGPASKDYSDVNITAGPKLRVKIIERNLDKKLIRPLAILPFFIIPVSKLNFTVEFLQDVEEGSKYYFNTSFGDGTLFKMTNVTSAGNTMHTVTVTNFTGLFVFSRLRVIKPLAPKGSKVLSPARFTFRGYCDSILVIA